MARPRKPIDIDRRGALMREARSSFARLGYAGTSLSSVLRASGFPRSSFYYFFDGKEALLDEAFADGLSRLAECAPPPDPGALTAETFWPRLFGFVDALAEAGTDPDLAATARLFHMPDAPASARRASFECGARRWCAEVLPEELHAELVWAVAAALDRWMASRTDGHADSRALVRAVMARLLGAPGAP